MKAAIALLLLAMLVLPMMAAIQRLRKLPPSRTESDDVSPR